MPIEDDIRRYWDEDAATYDASSRHAPTSPMVLAAWRSALETLLGRSPARVLDCGAGTGFLSLLAAELGHHVTATDLSPSMLARLEEKATARGLALEASVARADAPPGTGYDAVMERHLLWTLRDPVGTLRAWASVATPDATLLLVESVWGEVDPVERALGRARAALERLRGAPNEHHAEYDDDLREALPLSSGTHPERLVALVEESGWRCARLTRLRDVEWAERLAMPFPERLLGVPARFVVTARGASAQTARRASPATTRRAQPARGSRAPRRESTRSTASRAPDAGPE